MTNGNQTITPIYDKQRVGRGIAESLGLTKREYFAAMAMQGLLSVYDNNNHLVPNMPNVKYMAELSVTASDELIKQLNKTEQNA